MLYAIFDFFLTGFAFYSMFVLELLASILELIIFIVYLLLLILKWAAIIFILFAIVFTTVEYLSTMWNIMFKDRAHYLKAEKARRDWNRKAKEERSVQDSAVAVMRQWAKRKGQSDILARHMLLIETIYFPARNHQQHCIFEYFSSRQREQHRAEKARSLEDYLAWKEHLKEKDRRMLDRFHVESPEPEAGMSEPDWARAHARAMGIHGLDVEMRDFEEAFAQWQPQRYMAEEGRVESTLGEFKDADWYGRWI